MDSSGLFKRVIPQKIKKVGLIFFVSLFGMVCVLLILSSTDNDYAALTIDKQMSKYTSKKYYDQQGKWIMTLYYNQRGKLIRSDKSDGTVTIYDHDHQTTTIISNSEEGFRKAVHTSLYGISETTIAPLSSRSRLQLHSQKEQD